MRRPRPAKFNRCFDRRSVTAQEVCTCKDDCPALWVSEQGERLTYWGLRQIVRRRAAAIGMGEPGLHSFRRAFALNCLRSGVDIYSLQKLMGHADIQVLRRYLKQTDQDVDEAHRRGSPVDNFI